MVRLSCYLSAWLLLWRYGTVVDGPGCFLPNKPVDLRAGRGVMNGPIIVGINKEDGSLFVPICEFYN